jgi:NAD(P)-dependent dehydrogenase (short-subunit alcohol dehydrogenase family)
MLQENQVIRVGNSRGEYTVDLNYKLSIEKLLKKIGPFDGLICTAGACRFGNVNEASDNDFMFGINEKLMGQVNLVRIALRHINPIGSITLTTGIFAREPWPSTAPTAMVNAAIEGFVRAAALDLPNGIRINAVSPILINITAKKMGMDTAGTMSPPEAAKAYKASVEGDMTGQILDGRKYGKIEGREYINASVSESLSAA